MNVRTSSFGAALLGMLMAGFVRSEEPRSSSVVEIQARHDRALMRELTEYVRKNPKADDRDQAFSTLFNKAIEHDWFSENEQLALDYLKQEPEGPVKPLAQIVAIMARAHASRFDDALTRFQELMKGLGQAEQEEFASSFADTLATSAITAGEFAVARQVYELLLARFRESPNLVQKVRSDLNRIDKVGKPSPNLSVQDIRGQTLRLESLRGKYVLVDFWATWCAPCVAEIPRLKEAHAKYHNAGFEIVSVSLDETKSAVVDFVKARNLEWPQIHNASTSADVVEAFGITSIPASFLIDPEGTVIRLDLRGPGIERTLSQLIKRPIAAAGSR